MQDLLQGPRGHDLAAMHSRAGADFEDMIGRPDGVGVVLHDDHRVSQIAQPLERLDHLDVVLGVQSDARFVEHVQHPHQARADLRRQPDSLRFPAGKGRRPAVQVEVVQPDGDEQFEPRAHFAHDRLRDRPLPGRGPDRLQEREHVGQGHLTDLVEVAAVDGHQPAGALEPRAATFGTVVFHRHLLQVVVHPGVGCALFAVLPVVVLQLRDDPVELDLFAGVLLPLFRPRRQEDFELLPLRPVKQNLNVLSQFLVRNVEANCSGRAVQQPRPPQLSRLLPARVDERPLFRSLRIRDQ